MFIHLDPPFSNSVAQLASNSCAKMNEPLLTVTAKYGSRVGQRRLLYQALLLRLLMNKIALRISIPANNWTAERTIIARFGFVKETTVSVCLEAALEIQF